MHGSGGERWKQRRHMWPVHSNSTPVACELSGPDFFLKDGRKIQVGDCALFKPPLDSPPFIGIIRSLKSDKETNLRLDVNWLYRPVDLKLPKGISLDAAPNEIFYSFHKDEIPAASLLHPCKVAFLRKGVELPSSISAFVCRRVYDTDNKCLWWLTDRDYINERQEEVNQLLDKTRIEMHGVMQSGGRSPKPLNGSIPVVQLKSGSESVPNSSFITSHVKIKKRERGDQGSEPIKRERLFKAEDGESGQFRSDSMLKNEIAKITDKGGLIDFEGVEKFVKLMQPDSSGKKIDFADRMMLADVIAVTDRFDCLEWFLQLRGLPVLDEWLQEVHKGKIGDANGTKGSDKTVEDFLLALLHALDKLPVNLNALQTCNVGKSVNHLRTHKNSEIQKKARILVDTWKKRVEAEMDVNDAKSEFSRGVSWPSKSGPLEVSQVGTRKAGGSGDDGLKSSTHSNMFKHYQPKFGPTEMVVKSSALSSTIKSSSTVGTSSKDYNFKTLVGNSDLPLTPIKEERSSSSSQSQNNSQSSDHAKTVASSCKEDTRTSNSGSGSISKVSSGASRHQKSSNGIHLITLTGTQKVSGSGKLNAVNKSSTSEKTSPASHEKSPDASLVEHGYSRLVVKLPNACRSPIGTSRVVTEDQVVSCHEGSLHDEAGDNHDKKAKGRSDLLGASFGTEANSKQCHKKDQYLSSEEGKGIAACNEQSRLAEASEEQSETIAPMTGIISRPGKTYDASLCSMNALIESCVTFSETIVSSSPGDAVGMNLLASVAAGEMSKSNNASPLDSPQDQSPLAEESSAANDGQLKFFPEGMTKNKCNEADGNSGARGYTSSDPLGSNNMLLDRNGSHPASTSADSSRDGRGVAFGSSKDCNMPSNLQQNMERTPSKSDIKPDAEACDASVSVFSSYGAEEANTEIEEKVGGSSLPDSLLEEGTQRHENEKVDQTDETAIENGVVLKSEVTAATLEVEKQVDEKTSCLSSQLSGNAVQTHGDLTSGYGVEEKLPSTPEIHADSKEEKVDTTMILPEANPLEFKDKIEDILNSEIHVNQIGKRTPIQGSSMSERKDDCAVQDLGKTDDINNCCGKVSMHLKSPAIIPLPESDQGEKLSLNVPELIGTKEHVTNANPSLSAPKSDTVVKLDFDLNEGCCVDDGMQEEIIGSSSAVQMPSLSPFSISSASESFPVSITVASAAKGSVVPPENSLANKVELGWKGSAATSAFRRAEPRKNLEMPLSLSDVSLVTTASKEVRPPLDFDLNLPDQRLLEEVTLSYVPRRVSLESGSCDQGGGLDLDLNKVDESSNMGLCSVSKSRLELSMSSRPYVAGGLGNCGFSVSRNFDLNNGPSLDEMGAETVLNQQNKSYMPFSSLLPGMKVNSGEIGSFYSWFPQGNSYSAISAIPSFLPGRGEQSYLPAAVSQRVFAPPAGTGFATEIYRAPVLSSSPALTFPPTNPFSYSGFPFETSFPLQSNTFSGCSTSYMDSSSGGSLGFPTITSHLLGQAGVVPTPYPRPFIMSYPSGSGTVGPEIGKWGSHGLDLNAGHGIIDKERIDEKLPIALSQLSVPSSSQPFSDEQLNMFQIGGLQKRKEPDSGLDAADRLNYKQR